MKRISFSLIVKSQLLIKSTSPATLDWSKQGIAYSAQDTMEGKFNVCKREAKVEMIYSIRLGASLQWGTCFVEISSNQTKGFQASHERLPQYQCHVPKNIKKPYRTSYPHPPMFIFIVNSS